MTYNNNKINSIIITIIISERASICSVQWKSVIYIFICMYSFFYGTFTRTSTNNLDSVTNSTFHACGVGVALTNAADSSIAHTPRKKRKIKEKAGTGKRSQTEELEIQKKKTRLDVRII